MFDCDKPDSSVVGANSRFIQEGERARAATRYVYIYALTWAVLISIGQATSSERFHGEIDGETTFLYCNQNICCLPLANVFRTTDTSFVENPPTSSRASSKFSTPAPASRIGSRGGTAPAGRGGAARGGLRGTRGSGLARAKPRGAR
jgi:hypothetical protein